MEIVIIAVIGFFVMLVAWAGCNNRDRYNTCIVCGKTVSSEYDMCEECRFKLGY